MFYYTKPVPRVPGLKGSDLARAENLDSSGPYKRIGKQPLYGSGSGDGDGGGGDSSASCSKPITGGENGGDNNPTNLMTLGALSNCHQAGPPKYRPPCTSCPCAPPSPPPTSPPPGSPPGSPPPVFPPVNNGGNA